MSERQRANHELSGGGAALVSFRLGDYSALLRPAQAGNDAEVLSTSHPWGTFAGLT